MTGGVGASLVRIVVSAVKGPEWLRRSTTIATLSVAQSLLRLLHLQIAIDIGQLKNQMIAKHGAEVKVAEAEARRKLAEAAEAENHATLHRRTDLLAVAEQRQALAMATKAEAEARKAHAEAELMERVVRSADTRTTALTIEASLEDLKQAIRRVNSKGGSVFFDEAALRQLTARSDDPPQ